MTVRTAELLIAILLALCSIGLMIKSAELRIDWVPERGPGSGAWPFWLSAGMLLACLATIVRWFRKVTPESTNLDLFMTRETVLLVGISAGSIVFLLVVTHLLGIYVALFLFLLFYLKFVGRHSWLVTVTMMIVVPIFIFCLFEWALKIPLPKSISEPLFYPIYDLMYS
ncbi:MAG: tripartite tricarboxylate transporter TctB family protein [Gammaproteobacteria bacterium]|nr:tripartite tricarboxylate transporter TctB family protein [Gammaproteobacteria bacterium]